jgi:cell division transport system permease protein
MIIFYFREAFKSISRAKASFFLTFLSLTVAIILVVGSVSIFLISSTFENRVKNNVKVNVFLKENISNKEKEEYKKQLEENRFVSSVDYISKEEAKKEFIRQTGEDFSGILDYNPLPASFTLKINTVSTTEDSLNIYIKEISGFDWVDEVVFKDQFILNILNYLQRIKIYLFIITGIICLIAIYLVYSTVRVINKTRYRELETMKLVGAKLSTIKIPILFNSFTAGILSGSLAFAVFWYILKQVQEFPVILNFVQANLYLFIGIIIISGPLLSLLVTIFALKNVSLKI